MIICHAYRIEFFGGLTPGQRWFSFAELALGTFLVIGHNVYHIVPNEVPFLFVLFWISLKLRDGGWKVAGLRRPDSWKWTIVWALAAAALRISLGELVVSPLTARFFPSQHTSGVVSRAAGSWKAALLSLLIGRCTTICKSVHSTRLFEKRRIRS